MLPVNLARLLGPGRARPAFGARSLTIHDPDSGCGIATNSGKGNRLLTETGLHRNSLASLGAPARDHRLAALGLHSGTKSVRLRAVTSVRLECALGHETYLLLIQLVGAIMAIGRMRSINDPGQTGKPPPGICRNVASYVSTGRTAATPIAAPCLRQLQSRYLTDVFLRVLNRGGQKNLCGRFPPKHFFCASMRTVPAH
jgi:hypothetical protein